MDDFWTVFLTLWVTGFSSLYNFPTFFLPGKQPTYHYICSDINPSRDIDQPKNMNNEIELTFSVLLQICVSLMIKRAKNSVETQPESLPQQVNQFVIKKHSQLFIIKSRSLSGFSSFFITIGWFSLYLLVYLWLKQQSADQINNYPAHVVAFVFQYLFIGFSCIIVVSVYYARHKPMRLQIFNEIKERYSSING